MLTLAEAHRAIRVPVEDEKHDDDLTNIFIPTVTQVCESIAGPIMAGTERVWLADGGRVTVVLPSAFTSVLSVVENVHQLIPGAEFTADPVAGVVSRGTRIAPISFLEGYRNVAVTYLAGYAETEADVLPLHKMAARIILTQLWQADLIAFRSAGATDSAMPTGFAVPARARDLLSTTPNMPGFA